MWQRAFRLAIATYRATATFPREERYGLTGQMRRSAISIAANIAEGCGRGGATELARFVAISRGSASEPDTYLMMARELNMIAADDYVNLSTELEEVQRMLSSFRARVLKEDTTDYA